ncbi:MAG: hypothetical protein FWH03_01155 [Firmicutes bacterium]|nr:hypothetical protein [Bacillota bacterium]
MKKVVKLLTLGVVLIMGLGIFAGCGGNKYNAVLYDDAGEWIKESFLDENITYQNNDARVPNAKSFIIRNQTEFESIFLEFPHEIDFENEMFLLYVFACELGGRSYKIRKMIVENQNLTIEYKVDSNTIFNWSSAPWLRCFVVRMDKVDILSAEFKRV